MLSADVQREGRDGRNDPWIALAVLVGLWALFLARAPAREHYLENFDHGLQLCAGQQILFGKVPGRDMLIAGGPLAGYTSAAGLWLSRSLVGETLICALGYALSIWLLWLVLARAASRLAATLTALLAYILSARFYKWYVWLFPLATIWMLQCYVAGPPQHRRRWALVAGLLVGIEWLYRFDLGTTGIAACALVIALVEWRARGMLVRQLSVLGVAFALPLLAWFGFLALTGGLAACRDFVAMTRAGTSGVTTGMATALPEFLLRAPLHAQSIIVLSYVVVLLTYGLCLALGLWAEIRGRATPTSRLLLVVAIVGLSTFHQATHRRGPIHLLQVAPPAMIGACLLVSDFLGRAWFYATALPFRLLRAACLGYLILAVTTAVGLTQWGSQDLASFSLWPAQRFAGLADPLGADNMHPMAAALREVQRRTRPDQPILVFPLDSQYYALARRPLSGVLYAYWPGVFAASPWRDRNLAALQRDPPALVVVRADFLDRPVPQPDLVQQARASHAAECAWIRQHYREVVYRGGGLLLLARGK
jgi:hypothetical protein